MKIKLLALMFLSFSMLGWSTFSKASSMDKIVAENNKYSYDEDASVWTAEAQTDDLEMKIAVSKAWISYAQEVDALYGHHVDYSIDEDGDVWEQHADTMRLSER